LSFDDTLSSQPVSTMTIIRFVLAALFFLFAVDAAHAQLFFGINAGADINPDALHVGGQIQIPAGQTGVVVEPSDVYTFGSEDTVFGEIEFSALRGSLHGMYEFDLDRRGEFVFYPLAGVSVYRLSYSDCDDDFFDDCTSTTTGADFGGGVGFGAFFVEVFAGVGDLPEAAFRFKYFFGR
ncbi:MAG: hypothetical protein R3284_00935, partial [Rubricoccaceae bacterium]|nr:hypothetical protein [Rubricoccaceae bacterium]